QGHRRNPRLGHMGMRHLGLIGVLVCATAGSLVVSGAFAASRAPQQNPDYVHDPLPPGFQVVATEVDGPVFADANGRTLYTWPVGSQRNGNAGEQKGKPTCDNTKYTDNAGLMSPYPGGFTLPEVETRPTCLDLWPAVYATDADKAVGKWTVISRPDGKKQWA